MHRHNKSFLTRLPHLYLPGRRSRITIDAESFADQVNSAAKLLVDNKNTYTSLVTIKTCQVRQA